MRIRDYVYLLDKGFECDFGLIRYDTIRYNEDDGFQVSPGNNSVILYYYTKTNFQILAKDWMHDWMHDIETDPK